MGHDPLWAQIVLRTVEYGVHIYLVDESGMFIEIEPPECENPPPLYDPPCDESGEGSDEPAVVRGLRVEIEQLKKELEVQKNRVRELWKLKCDQLADMDSSLLQKDEAISHFKAEIACHVVSPAA